MRIARTIAALALAAALAAGPGCGGSGSSTIGRSAASVAKESRVESGRKYTIGPQYESQLEQMISREVVALGGKDNVPMELNRQVLLNINYFLNDARGFMTKGLSRGSKYIPMMKAIFRQKGLPEDLVYLALIESGYKTSAVSTASAVGPWQFIAATGRRYGLTINEYVDERMDPVKSTYAAADYLTTLHNMFNSWPLAIAAYNSGENKIRRGMENYGVNNFWDMTDVGGHLANETKLYVPSFLAATFIAKDPDAYGLTIELQQPDEWEEVVVPGAVSFKDAASYCGTTVDRLKELNPHLKKDTTPPDETNFALRIPVGGSQQFTKAYAKAGKGQALASAGRSPMPDWQPAVKTAQAAKPTISTITHKVKPGDTLTVVAKRYGVSTDLIKKSNNLKTNTLASGQILKIPSDLPLTAKKTTESSPLMVVENPNPQPRSTSVHTVVAGESLGGIAQKYNMSLRELVDINNLDGTTIRTGQKLKVAGSPAPAAKAAETKASADAKTSKAAETKASTAAATGKTGTHTVVAGENLGGIARKYDLTTKELMALNGLDGPAIRAGQKLKVPAAKAAASETKSAPKAAAPEAKSAAKTAAPEAKSAPKTAEVKPAAASGVHTVASGENVGVIAQKYGLTPKELMALNGLDGPTIRVGQKLKVSGKVPATAAGGASDKKADTKKTEARSAATYKVTEGDTLYSIARKNDISVSELKKLNNLEADTVKLGQSLKLK